MESSQSFGCTFSGRQYRTPKMRITSIIAVCVLGLGCSACSKTSNGNPSDPSNQPGSGSTITYTAIGASDVNGIGSSLACLPLTTCNGGKGYVPVTADRLRARGFTVDLRILGIPTSVISRRVQTLGQKYGRDIFGNFISDELPLVRKDDTLVTIFAGGNDVNTVIAAINGGEAAAIGANSYIDQQIAAFGNDYAALINGIRAVAPSARIVALNLPNIGGLPFLAGASLSQRQAAQRLSVGMTTSVVNTLTSQGVRVVDLICEPRIYEAAQLSSDGFHPNDAGYSILADAVVNAAISEAYPAPKNSCPQMTIVP